MSLRPYVLLVAADAEARALLTEQAGSDGHQVLSLQTTGAALTVLRAMAPPFLVVWDLRPEDEDGRSLELQLAAVPWLQDVPLLLLANHSILPRPHVHILQKPITTEALRAAVRDCRENGNQAAPK